MTVGDDTNDERVGRDRRRHEPAAFAGPRRQPLELLSDPKGVDFRPYLIQGPGQRAAELVCGLSGERPAWGYGEKWKPSLSIKKDGSIPKLVLVLHSAPALERAAVAGIDASTRSRRFPESSPATGSSSS